MNNSGLVVGFELSWPQLPQAGPQHAFAWTESSGMVDLGTLGGETAPRQT